MAKHEIYGVGLTIFESNKTFNKIVPFYVEATEFGIIGADGTRTYFHGVNLLYDWSSQSFVGGDVNEILHFSAAGEPLDALSGLSLDAFGLNNLMSTAGNGLNSSFVFEGNDIIDGRIRAGNAVVNDVILAGLGHDRVYAGSGDDQSFGSGGHDRLFGGAGNDILNGGTGTDRLVGGIGNDTLFGDDFQNSDAGNDMLLGGAGGDLLFGEQMVSTSFMTGDFDDVLDGGNGRDVLYGRSGDDVIDGGEGVDTAFYFGHMNQLEITQTASGFSVLSASQGTDVLTGIERIATSDGLYEWCSTDGTWMKIGALSGQTVIAPDAAERIFSNASEIINLAEGVNFAGTVVGQVVRALGGNDVVNLSPGGVALYDTSVFGGAGDDAIFVSSYNVMDAIGERYAEGWLYLDGGSGDDNISGGGGDNILIGGSGSDTLHGRGGDDLLSGGSGRDIFVFERSSYSEPRQLALLYNGFGDDKISDFSVGQDSLNISGEHMLSLTETAEGTLITVEMFTSKAFEDSGNIADPNALQTSTILLEGVMNVTLSDLFLT